MSATLPLKTGGPAFPPYPSDETKYGASILDWFAGHALAGLCANPSVVDQSFVQALLQPSPQPQPKEDPETKVDPVPVTPDNLSLIAYVIAAEMIELRDQVPITPQPIDTIPEETTDLIMPPDSLLPHGSVTTS